MLRFKNGKICLSLTILLGFLLVGCLPNASTPTPTDPVPKRTKVTATVVDPQALTEAPTQPPSEETEETHTVTAPVEQPGLPAEPLPQNITASDGTALAGRLYPAASREAPLLVLMHWAPGDQKDWATIASWLQNRSFQLQVPHNPPPWLTPDWFPEMPEGESFHVLTFTFRGCEGACKTFDREGWLMDVEAVMEHLEMLEDVTFSQVATVGASIGADGAVYGCYYYNQQGGSCLGALSLSPGGYLNQPYPQLVDALGSEEPPKPAWCLYSTGDGESANACEDASGDHYRAVSYPGSAHGMALVEPDQDPNPLNLILEFLSQTGLCAACCP